MVDGKNESVPKPVEDLVTEGNSEQAKNIASRIKYLKDTAKNNVTAAWQRALALDVGVTIGSGAMAIESLKQHSAEMFFASVAAEAILTSVGSTYFMLRGLRESNSNKREAEALTTAMAGHLLSAVEPPKQD